MVKEIIQHLYIIEYSAAGKKNGAVMAWKDVWNIFFGEKIASCTTPCKICGVIFKTILRNVRGT